MKVVVCSDERILGVSSDSFPEQHFVFAHGQFVQTIRADIVPHIEIGRTVEFFRVENIPNGGTLRSELGQEQNVV